jgi:hypothetical protein
MLPPQHELGEIFLPISALIPQFRFALVGRIKTPIKTTTSRYYGNMTDGGSVSG